MRKLLLLVVASLATIPALAQKDDPTNRAAQLVTEKIGIDQKLNNQVPLNLKFTDEYGKEVMLNDYFRKRPVLLVPIFFDCKGTCTLVFDGLMKALIGLKKPTIGREFEVVTVSIHPKEGPKEAMERKEICMEVYGREGADKGWHFLTGSQESITALTEAIGFRYVYDEKRDQINHPAGIMVLTPDGRVSQYYYGVEYASKMLDKSFKIAAKNDVGAVAEVKLFGCFEYDPITGTYKLVVMQALKVAGISTVLILAFSIVLMSRRYKASATNEQEEPKA